MSAGRITPSRIFTGTSCCTIASTGDAGVACASRSCGALNQAGARANPDTKSTARRTRLMRQASCRVAAHRERRIKASAIIFHFLRARKEQNTEGGDEAAVRHTGGPSTLRSRIIVIPAHELYRPGTQIPAAEIVR